jgi:ATP-dependent protease ClpP protease subunit
MKKLLLAIAASILISIGCAGTPVNTAPVNETIWLDGDLHQFYFRKFYEWTDTGADHYTIIINTDGGSAQGCTGVISRMTELQDRGVKFTTIVYTKAYSAGAFIWMMGDTRVMYRGSQLMWHNIRGQMNNDERELPVAYGEDRAEMFVALDDNMNRLFYSAFPNVEPILLETIIEYTGMTFMTAQDAVDIGMLDKVTEKAESHF